MPKFLRNQNTKGYEIFAWSADCKERMHVHVKKENRIAKFWIDTDDVPLFKNPALTGKEVKEARKILKEHLAQLRREWQEYCAGVE